MISSKPVGILVTFTFVASISYSSTKSTNHLPWDTSNEEPLTPLANSPANKSTSCKYIFPDILPKSPPKRAFVVGGAIIFVSSPITVIFVKSDSTLSQ